MCTSDREHKECDKNGRDVSRIESAWTSPDNHHATPNSERLNDGVDTNLRQTEEPSIAR